MRIGEAVRKRIIALCEENKITVNMLATISDGLHISISDFFNDELFKNIEQEIR